VNSELKLKSFKEYHFIPAKNKSPLLLICLHGQGASLLQLRSLRSRFRLDQWNYLFLNAPDSIESESHFGGFSWYHRPPFHWPGINRSLGLLRDLMQELTGEGFSKDKTVWLGFSQGAALALEMILSSPEPYLGLVALSGWIHDPETLGSRSHHETIEVPVLMTHGPRDDVLPLKEVKKRLPALVPFLPNLEFQEFDKAHEIIKEEHKTIRQWLKKRGNYSPSLLQKTGLS
jgi:phospholipase/carboxylesterase